MPSRTLTFNLICSIYFQYCIKCDLIAVLFIISCMSNFNSFYQDVY